MGYGQYRNKFHYYVESHKIAYSWPFLDLEKWPFHVVQPNLIRILVSHSHAKKPEVLAGNFITPNLTSLLIFPQKATSDSFWVFLNPLSKWENLSKYISRLEPVKIWGTQALAVKISLQIKFCMLDHPLIQWSVHSKACLFEKQLGNPT